MADPGPSAEHSLNALVNLALAVRRVILQDPNDSERLAEFDSLFKTLPSIDSAHSEVHEGDTFATGAVDITLANTETLALAFKTMAGTKRAHLVMEFSTLTGGHIELIEGPTWTNQTGTKNPIHNRKREASMKSSGLLEDQAQAEFVASDNVILNPAVLAGGTALHTVYGFGKKEKFPAGGRDLTEWLLKPDTQYAVKFTSDAGSNMAQLILCWYEHTDE